LAFAGRAAHDIQFPFLYPEDSILGEFTSELDRGWQITTPDGKSGFPVLHVRRYAGYSVTFHAQSVDRFPEADSRRFVGFLVETLSEWIAGSDDSESLGPA
jgi:hypothetical protein